MASLILKEGKAAQSSYPLDKELLTLGRSEHNDVVIPDARVSREHAQIQVWEDVITLTDLGSSNGTYVNDVQVARQVLMENSEIKLGGTVFLFTDQESKFSRGKSPSKAHKATPQTIRYQKELATTEMDYAIEGNGELVRERCPEYRLQLLYRMARSLHSTLDLPALLHRVVEILCLGLHAEGAAVLLIDESGDGFIPAAQMGSQATPWPVEPPANILKKLLAGRALVSVPEDDEAGANCLLWLPLWDDRRVSGLIEVSRSVETGYFDSEDLAFGSAIAGQAATGISDARAFRVLKDRHSALIKAMESENPFIARSQAMVEVLRIAERVARTSSTVLLRGESGTGKEMVAQLIHRLSERREGPLICVNCAVLTDSLLESELFGHEKGSFTGAVKQRVGRFEMADGGTIFLDEIGDISPETQAKLLRVLQESEFERVGGTQPIEVNVRVIAATNRNLEEAMAEGSFRDDLFYRLNVVDIKLPPLRDRPEDIPPLAEHFLAQLRKKIPTGIRRISKDALKVLEKHLWPGNCRELRNVIERALVLGDGDMLVVQHLPGEITEPVPLAPETAPSKEESEKDRIVEMLRQCNWNKMEASQKLGFSRSTLYNKIKRYGIPSSDPVDTSIGPSP